MGRRWSPPPTVPPTFRAHDRLLVARPVANDPMRHAALVSPAAGFETFMGLLGMIGDVVGIFKKLSDRRG
jgi:hypothetical protein